MSAIRMHRNDPAIAAIVAGMNQTMSEMEETMNLADHAAKLRRDKRTEFWRCRAEKMTARNERLAKENQRLAMIVAAYRSRVRALSDEAPAGSRG